MCVAGLYPLSRTGEQVKWRRRQSNRSCEGEQREEGQWRELALPRDECLLVLEPCNQQRENQKHEDKRDCPPPPPSDGHSEIALPVAVCLLVLIHNV